MRPTLTSREVTSQAVSSAEAAAAFEILDRFLQQNPLTAAVARLESTLANTAATDAAQLADQTEFTSELIEAALIVRGRVGMLDSVIHAAVITQTLPFILGDGEHLTKRPSLAAGNDATRIYDLETNVRVAEFKVAQWNGSDGVRQRGVVADLVGLAMDPTPRQRQLFVVGDRPRYFLQTSRRRVAKVLSKSSMRVRLADFVDDAITVAELTRDSGVEIIDLTQWFPRLKA